MSDEQTIERIDTVVIGGGQAGLSAVSPGPARPGSSSMPTSGSATIGEPAGIR
jgi:hypothetical protein